MNWFSRYIWNAKQPRNTEWVPYALVIAAIVTLAVIVIISK